MAPDKNNFERFWKSSSCFNIVWNPSIELSDVSPTGWHDIYTSSSSVVDADLLLTYYDVPGFVVILLGVINFDNPTAVLGIIVAKAFFLKTIIP